MTSRQRQCVVCLDKNVATYNAFGLIGIDAGDHQLNDHVETCARNATYISNTYQNDLICIKDYT